MAVSPGEMAEARGMPLFCGLDGSVLNDISQNLSVLNYQRGERLLEESDDGTDVYVVIEGAVIAKSFSKEGKEITYSVLSRGEIFGEFSAIDGAARSASIEAIEDSRIARMSSHSFRGLIASQPQIGLKLAEHLVCKSRELTRRVFEFGLLSVRERLQNELLRLCSDSVTQEATIDPAPTHYEIAIRIATHREAVSRELGQLAAQGIIDVGRKSLKINDIQRLRTMSHDVR